MDISWFNDYLNGVSSDAYKHLGAHHVVKEGKEGYEFLLYAPLAKEVNLTGDFNAWSVFGSEMEKIDDRGLFYKFVPGAQQYQSYKYHILGCDGMYRDKADPFGFFSELRPASSSRLFDIEGMIFHDEKWMKKRDRMFDKPMSIYEMHLGSWLGPQEDGRMLSYEEIAPKLIDYLKANGFTTIEIMPITQYPFDGSWGYQATGYFAVDSRYGNPKQLMSFVDRMHQAGFGVILDFVAVHFATDKFGLERFDGSCMYEYSGDNEWSQWGTKNFDLGKDPVRSFLISSMCYFLDYFHFDGIRMDAVSNIIYYGGNTDRGENKGGIDFVKRATYTIHSLFPSVMMIAEDSSAYGHVTKGFDKDGLGFDYKWDLGWMNDTLKYYKLDPIYKKYDHNLITFSMAYFYSENFILPLSHDEVVHMKGTIVNKMWGNYYNKFALARNLYAYQFAHPGKKLNFMGNELGTFDEWNERRGLAWNLKTYPMHDAFSRYFRDLNMIYKSHKAMYLEEYNPNRFHWIMVDNKDQSVFSFYREARGETMVFVFNMTPNYYGEYRMGVPYPGEYEEILNSDKGIYNGADQYNGAKLIAEEIPMHGMPYSINMKISSFGASYLVHVGPTPLAEDEKKPQVKKTVRKTPASRKRSVRKNLIAENKSR